MPIEIYSTETDAGSVSVVEKVGPRDYQLAARIAVGTAPRGAVQFTHDGRGYVANSRDGTVSEIDLAARKEIARIDVGGEPRAVALVPGGSYAVVSDSATGCVSMLDLDLRRAVARLPVGAGPRHIAVTADGRWAYVAVSACRCVARIDLSPLARPGGPATLAGMSPAGRLPTGEKGQPNSVTLHNDGRRAFVAKTDAPSVAALDLEAGAVMAEIPIGGKGGRAIAITPDGRYGFASVEHRSEVAAIDLDEGRLVRRISVGSCPRGIAVDPQELTVYSCGFSRNARRSRSSCTPKALTVVHLGSGHLDDGTAPEYSEIPLDAGPSSVSVLDADSMT